MRKCPVCGSDIGTGEHITPEATGPRRDDGLKNDTGSRSGGVIGYAVLP